MREVSIPAVGFAMSEAVLIRWLKQPGEFVEAGVALAEIETDKAIADLESPAAGVLGRLRFDAGDVVPVGVVLTVVLESGETEADEGRQDQLAVSGAVEHGEAVASDGRNPDAESGAVGSAADAPSREVPDERPPHRISPRQRRTALHAAAMPSAAQLQTGADWANGEAPLATPAITPGQVDVAPAPVVAPPVGRFREAIAQRVTHSWQSIPHFAVTREIRADTILEIRARRTRSAVLVPTVTDLLLIGLAHALRATSEPGPIDVGLAVATPDGVLIPVIRDVLACSLSEVAAARAAAIDRARRGRLSASELDRPPRSTLSNLGPQGVDQFTGVIATGQASLLTVGRIARRVVDVSGGIGVRPTFYATLNADHRVMDGAEAAALLGAFADAVMNSLRLDSEEYG